MGASVSAQLAGEALGINCGGRRLQAPAIVEDQGQLPLQLQRPGHADEEKPRLKLQPSAELELPPDLKALQRQARKLRSTIERRRVLRRPNDATPDGVLQHYEAVLRRLEVRIAEIPGLTKLATAQEEPALEGDAWASAEPVDNSLRELEASGPVDSILREQPALEGDAWTSAEPVVPSNVAFSLEAAGA